MYQNPIYSYQYWYGATVTQSNNVIYGCATMNQRVREHGGMPMLLNQVAVDNFNMGFYTGYQQAFQYISQTIANGYAMLHQQTMLVNNGVSLQRHFHNSVASYF